MRGWLTSLAAWCRLPVRGGFVELDLQIDKLRMLRDSYQAQPHIQLRTQTAGAKKCGKQLCIR
jgi:hypothetical protein